MSDHLIRAWMPITKKADGTFEGILSDTSLDRDSEFMTKELLEQWAKKKSIPMLLNHENRMEKLVGVWKGLRVVSKGRRTALVAQPHFFSAEANPLAQQAKKQVEEALALGMNPGISIGAIPAEEDATVEKEIEGKTRRGYNKAELVEATLVPVQSNRNASFAAVAKEFDISPQETEEIQKGPPIVEMCVKRRMNEGESREEAFDNCMKEVYPGGADHLGENKDVLINNQKEENTMEKTYSQEELDAHVAKQVEEALAKAGEGEAKPEDEKKEEEEKKEKEDEKKSLSAEIASMKKMMEELSKNRFANLSKAPTVEKDGEGEEEAEAEGAEAEKTLDMNVMVKHYYK